MAKENLVILHGAIQCAPRIYANSDGNVNKAMLYMKVLRRPSISEKLSANRIFFDNPIILSKNEKLIAQMSELEKDDMLDVRGVLTTREVLKSTICPNCAAKNSVEGNTVYVTPIYLCRREPKTKPEEALELLKKRCEVSNMIMVIGTRCRDPEFYQAESRSGYVQYQLAVNRKFRIREDPADLKTDYPWVKAYGSQAISDAKCLQTGSVVYINGALQTREVNRTTVCPSCGQSYTWKDAATEIVPYSTEYLVNCLVPEKDETKMIKEAEHAEDRPE